MSIRRILLNHKMKATWVVVVGALLIYPVVLMRLNPPPTEEKVDIVQGTVLAAKRDQPHISLQLGDGRTEDFNFPSDLLGLLNREGLRFREATDYELRELHGCRAELRVDRIRYLVIPSDRRVWSLRCGSISIPYSRIVSYYRSESAFRSGHWILVFGAAFLLLGCAIRDAKDAKMRSAASAKSVGSVKIGTRVSPKERP